MATSIDLFSIFPPSSLLMSSLEKGLLGALQKQLNNFCSDVVRWIGILFLYKLDDFKSKEKGPKLVSSLLALLTVLDISLFKMFCILSKSSLGSNGFVI